MAAEIQGRSQSSSPLCSASCGLGTYFIHDIFAIVEIDLFQVDVCDQKCHFGSEVPQRAVHYPVLLYAIFALASLHRNTLLGIEDTVPEEYHNQCLQLLIPVLDDPQGVVDENFLAAVVILRSYEEMSSMHTRSKCCGGF